MSLSDLALETLRRHGISAAGNKDQSQPSLTQPHLPETASPLETQGLNTRVSESHSCATETFETEAPAHRTTSATLTLKDLPMLEARLRSNGWHVVRHGNELVCTSRHKPQIQ